MAEQIIVTDEGATRMITMRRPEKKKTLTQEMYLAMSSTWSDASIHLAALTSIALVGVAVWFCAPLVAQPERTLDRSTPVTAPR